MSSSTMNRRAVLKKAGLVGIAAGAAAVASSGSADAAQEMRVHPAVGTWESRYTRPGEKTPNYSLLQFQVGGTVVFSNTSFEAATNGDTQVEYEGAPIGVWESAGARSVAFTTRTGTYNAQEVWTGYEEGYGTFDVAQDGKSARMSVTFTEFDTAGKQQHTSGPRINESITRLQLRKA